MKRSTVTIASTVIIKILLITLLTLTSSSLVYGGKFKTSHNYQPKSGDFIFQSIPHSDLVDAIEGATNSPYSHVGLVIQKEGQWYVREAISVVKDTPLQQWIHRGRQGHFDVYRLTEKYQAHIPQMINESANYLGRPYDFRYRLDDEYIYCSELLYKAFFDATEIKLGELKQLKELNWRPFKKTIEKYEQGEVPLDRKMITPADLATAKELVKVYSHH